MKKILATICLLAVVGLFLSLSDGFAQAPAGGSLYRVKLRGGIKLKGEIQQLQPTGTFTFRGKDGKIDTYQATDIKYLKPLRNRESAFSGHDWRYRSIMEIGVGGSEEYSVPNTKDVYHSTTEMLLYTSYGLQYKHLFFAGLGAGFNLEGAEGANVPVFAHLRLIPFKTAVSPVFVSNIGYHFNIEDSSHGFYFSPGGGVKFRLSDRTDVHLIVATRSLHQTVDFYKTTVIPGNYPNYNSTYLTERFEHKVTKRFFDFRCGFTF